MDAILWFKIVQVSLLAVFAVFISDFRRRKHMTLSAPRALVVLLKIMYLVPVGIYVACLLSVRHLAVYDVLGLVLTTIGTLIVLRAKLDLGAHHTWTGYRLTSTRVVTHGVYSYIRHPIYAGIFVFVSGGICTALPRVSWLGFAVGLGTLAYIGTFLVIAARRESRHFAVVHGDEYQQYARQVHPFLPVRRYRRAA